MQGLTAPFFYQQFFLPDGKPASGGKLYFYVAGSTVLPKNVYVGINLVQPYTQPLVLDASGVAPQYFLESGLYKIVLKDSTGVIIHTYDDVEGVGSGGTSVSDHKVAIDDQDTAAYIPSKVVGSASIDLSVIGSGASKQLQATVKPAGISGLYKVKTSDADPIGNTLFAKLDATRGLWFEEKFITPGSGEGYIELSSLGQLAVGNNDWLTGLATLDNKTKAGDGITLDVVTDGSLGGVGNQLVISSKSFTKVSETDPTPAPLSNKLVPYTGISIDQVSGVGGFQWLNIASLGYVTVGIGDGVHQDSLDKKLMAGAGITLDIVTDGQNGNRLVINAKGNSWRLLKYVTSNHTVLDTDDTIVVRAAGISITFPTPSASYEGRIVTLRSAQLGFTASVLGAVIGATTVPGLGKLEIMCFNTGSGYFWVQQ